MIMRSLHDSLGNATENFWILTLSCHFQTIVMAALVFFIELPKWQWHYDHALDSLYLTATSRIHLYIFFQCSFTEPILSLMFDLEAPVDGVLLFIAHLIGAPLQPSPKTDPSEASASTSSSSSALKGDRPSPGGLGAASIMANGFLSSELG